MHALLAWYHTVMAGCVEEPTVYRTHQHRAFQHLCSLRSGGLWLTKHAVTRFVERHRPGVLRNDARLELLGLASEIGSRDTEYGTIGDVHMVIRGRRVVTVLP